MVAILNVRQLPLLGIAFAIGVSIGLFYFGGLWFTVQRLLATQHPFRWLLGSFCLRLSVSLLVFYLIIKGAEQQITSLLFCVFGFLLVRGLLCRLAIQRR
ncbi:MAG: ATP synthase subunit I [Cyanophyceae cyanobacterium]